jgi:hypothetical protein
MRGIFNVAIGSVKRSCNFRVPAEQFSDCSLCSLNLGNPLPSDCKS